MASAMKESNTLFSPWWSRASGDSCYWDVFELKYPCQEIMQFTELLSRKPLEVEWRVDCLWLSLETVRVSPQGMYVTQLLEPIHVWSECAQPPLAIQATWGVISKRKTLLELLQIFGTLAERKGTWTHQLLPPLVLRAPSNGQLASQGQIDTTVVLHAPNSGLRLERDRGLNYFYLPRNSSSYEKLQFLLLLNWTRYYLLHKISSSSSEDQPFSGCTNWRSDSLSIFFRSSHSSIKVKNPPSATCSTLELQP